MAGGQISQKEYLKRYLSGPSKDEKKKKKKKQQTAQRLTIIDDNLDPLQQDAAEVLDLYDTAENAPQVVALVDERPAEVQIMEVFSNTSKWRTMANSNFIKQEPLSPPAEGGNNSDFSPPRQDFDLSPPRTQNRRDEDLSPPRAKRTRDDDSDVSPPRSNSKKHGSRRDGLSPPRSKRTRDDDSDVSPPRSKSKKHSSRRDEDISPPRSKRTRDDNSDVSPPRSKSKQHSSRRRDDDISPPRSRRTRDDAPDVSPPRSKRHRDNRDVSPPRSKSKKQSSRRKSADFSPHRAKPTRGDDSDVSPPRSGRSRTNTSPPRPRAGRSRWGEENNEDVSPPRKSRGTADTSAGEFPLRRVIKQEPDTEKQTLDGKTAGLQDAATLKREAERLRAKEEEHFAQMSDLVSGRGAKAVMRDRKTGKKRDLTQEAAEQQAKEAEEAKKLADFQRVGKGVVQVEEQSRRVQDYVHEASKPMARYVDDEDLENMLRAQEREGDPMLEYLREKRTLENPEANKPRFLGPFPANRFNIRPGHRWDGVDRSTGFEKKLFDSKSAKKALEEEAYKWSVADM